jgi:hypothetical protein
VQAYVKKDGKTGKRKKAGFDEMEKEHSTTPHSLATSNTSQPLANILVPDTEIAEPEKGQEVIMDLNSEQAEAVGPYWKNMNSRRSTKRVGFAVGTN